LLCVALGTDVRHTAVDEESLDHIEQIVGADQAFDWPHDHRFVAKHANDGVDRNAGDGVALLRSDALHVGDNRNARSGPKPFSLLFFILAVIILSS
jgi:hypothetical protein